MGPWCGSLVLVSAQLAEDSVGNDGSAPPDVGHSGTFTVIQEIAGGVIVELEDGRQCVCGGHPRRMSTDRALRRPRRRSLALRTGMPYMPPSSLSFTPPGTPATLTGKRGLTVAMPKPE